MFSRKETRKKKILPALFFLQSHTSTCTFDSGEVTKVSADKNLGPGPRKRSCFFKERMLKERKQAF